MINLSGINQSLQITLALAHDTSPLDIVSAFADDDGFSPGNQLANSNGVTAADFVSAPDADTIRMVKTIHICNTDAISHTITVTLLDDVTSYKLVELTLAVGETLYYSSETGWAILNLTP